MIIVMPGVPMYFGQEYLKDMVSEVVISWSCVDYGMIGVFL